VDHPLKFVALSVWVVGLSFYVLSFADVHTWPTGGIRLKKAVKNDPPTP
jgi:hypothetical protein